MLRENVDTQPSNTAKGGAARKTATQPRTPLKTGFGLTNGVIPKPRAFTSGARDLACSSSAFRERGPDIKSLSAVGDQYHFLCDLFDSVFPPQKPRSNPRSPNPNT